MTHFTPMHLSWMYLNETAKFLEDPQQSSAVSFM